MEVFGKLCLALIMIIVSTLISGFVLMKLYYWIVCPIYGLQPITQVQAIGLSFFTSFFLQPVILNMKSDQSEDKGLMFMIVSKFFTCLFVYGFMLLTGYIISLYI